LRRTVVACSVLALLIFAGLISAQSRKAVPQKSSQIERGKYLVENVGMCQDCHSPRNERGEYIKERWLHGAPVLFKPSADIPWAPLAPPLAGLVGYTDEQAMKFLTTGVNSTGGHPRPPMPEYRLNRDDAAAVIAYLRSLPPPKNPRETAATGE